MSNHLRAAREALGLTQQQVADKIGCDQPTISRYERGNSRPDIDLAPKIAEALGLSVIEVLYGPTPADPQQKAA